MNSTCFNWDRKREGQAVLKYSIHIVHAFLKDLVRSMEMETLFL